MLDSQKHHPATIRKVRPSWACTCRRAAPYHILLFQEIGSVRGTVLITRSTSALT
jgi:hypothetical protein